MVEGGVLPEDQHGGLKGKGTAEHLIRLCEKARRACKHGKGVMCVLADVSKAFDSLDPETLVYWLHKMGFTQRVIKWIYSWTSNRTYQVRVGGDLSSAEHWKRGSAQGSLLTPGMWAVVYSQVVRNFVDVESPLFVDDLAIYLEVNEVNWREKEKMMQMNLDRMSRFCSKWGLILNVDKTKVLIFTRSKKLNHVNLHCT